MNEVYDIFKLIDYNNKVFGAIFGVGAPNEAHYADRATWLAACADYECKMGLAASEATVGDEPEQEAAYARYREALARVRK